MDNREYRENQKIQRKSFNDYRKHMIKVLLGFGIAIASISIFPEYVFPYLNTFLKGFMSDYLAGSLTLFTQLAFLIGGTVSGVVNSFKAVNDKVIIDKAQDREEEIIDKLINENEKLSERVNTLENEKANSISKTSSKTNTRRRVINPYEEEQVKVKKYTR